MKIWIKKDHVLVIAPKFVRFIGGFATGTREAKGLAIFPFIFISKEEYIQPWLINHELIHFRQTFETLFLGLFFLIIFEMLYARVFLKKSMIESYLYTAAEQEAYQNQNNLEYLKNRKFGSVFWYIKNKTQFTFGEELGTIRYL